MSGTINPSNFVSAVNVQNNFGASANIPELIMAVQIERTNVIENQVKHQIGDMQTRNAWLKDANAALAALRTARPADTTGSVNYNAVTFKNNEGNNTSALDFLTSNGIAPPVDTKAIAETQRAKTSLDNHLAFIDDGIKRGSWAAEGWKHYFPSFQSAGGSWERVNEWGVRNGLTTQTADGGKYTDLTGLQTNINSKLHDLTTLNQGEFDVMINNLKSSIDTVNSQSQMDMVRLQGLMDKRNQSFDMLTNNISKFGKSMDSVIGNMR